MTLYGIGRAVLSLVENVNGSRSRSGARKRLGKSHPPSCSPTTNPHKPSPYARDS
jgi:hypothetical protein